MIEFRNGRYAYGDFALDINLEVKRGSFTAVLGPSGSGKSTLLNIIAGFENLVAGQLLIADEDMLGVRPAARSVSMVFQDNNTFAHLSVWKNVALGISPSLHLTDEQRHSVADALRKVGIDALAERLPGSMSGGERQRVGIARALVRNKPILLLDEPFAALGPALRKDMLRLVRALHEEKKLTTLMVTHAPGDAKLVADQVIYVDQGLVRAPLSVKDFFLSRDAAIVEYLG